MREFYKKYHVVLHLLVICGVAFAVYSNNYRHDYLLDSGHSLKLNSYVRSLKHIPTYFKDPKTLTSYRGNADYRPVLQITYAVNYRISKYDTWSWHLFQILLHLICALTLYLLCRKLLRQFEPDGDRLLVDTIPFVVALLFVVHPTSSGVVNYLHARSSLLVAALLLPSIVLVMKRHDDPAFPKTPWIALLLYTLALFSKVEAVACLAVYLLSDVLQMAHARGQAPGKDVSESHWRQGFVGDLLRTANLRTLRRLGPFVAVTGVYFIIRSIVVEDYVAQARAYPDMTGWIYLCTQVTAWWHYVLRWFAPVGLVADNMVYPVYRSATEPAVLLAVAGWVLFAGLLKAQYRRYPHYTFLALSALALLSPTSSVVPLAEMVNEHRPYLPFALLSMVWLIPGLRILSGWAAKSRLSQAITGAGLVLLVISLFTLTFTRNRVFSTGERYYLDILKKAPSPRAHVNYGRTQLQKGKLNKALVHFKRAAAMAPGWHIAHINLGVAYGRLGKHRLARWHLDQAVRTDRYTSLSLEFRGRFNLSQKEYGAALNDLQKARKTCRECYDVYTGLATAYAGVGNWKKSLYWTRHCLKVAARRTEKRLARMSVPFWESPARYRAGYQYYRAIDRQLPGRWWVNQNLADLAFKLGFKPEAQRLRKRAAKLKVGQR